MKIHAICALAMAAFQAVLGAAESSKDFAQLSLDGSIVFNNVWNKGAIHEARQTIFVDGTKGGWTWDWPEKAGPAIKAYPEIIIGRSPWSSLKGGDQLPVSLGTLPSSLDFAIETQAKGSWCTSFDFWITKSKEPSPQSIVCNVTLWTTRSQLEPSYFGKHETVTIGDRTFDAIIQMPADKPSTSWVTLCLVDREPRTSGVLDLGALSRFLLERGFAHTDDFLATVELGNEVAYGEGKTTITRFALR